VSESVPTAAEFAALQARVEALEARLADAAPEPEPEFLTVAEAALRLGCGHRTCPTCNGNGHTPDPKKPGETRPCRRCKTTGEVVNRARVDHLLSAGLIPRVKEGSRTLLRVTDLDAHLTNGR
jgi:hypothetical protein